MAHKISLEKDIKRALFATGILVILALVNFTAYNQPQCPNYYTQDQIAATDCNAGSNIGVSLIFLYVVIPLSVYVAILWFQVLNRLSKKRK